LKRTRFGLRRGGRSLWESPGSAAKPAGGTERSRTRSQPGSRLIVCRSPRKMGSTHIMGRDGANRGVSGSCPRGRLSVGSVEYTPGQFLRRETRGRPVRHERLGSCRQES